MTKTDQAMESLDKFGRRDTIQPAVLGLKPVVEIMCQG